MNWKSAARVCLHSFGALELVRRMRLREFRVLMFHEFRAADEANVKAICAHVARHFEPVTLSDVADAISGRATLPDAAVAVTVDDGYRNYLEHGHAFFRRERIPVTIYAVSGFADGRLWLWTDQVDYCLEHAKTSSIRAEIEGIGPMDLKCGSDAGRAESFFRVAEALKTVTNRARQNFIGRLGKLCGVEIPPQPPAGRAALSWNELRALSAEAVEIGCHTATHPILSRLAEADLEAEIRGAKELMEERLQLPVRHFCYPNGKNADLTAEVVGRVRAAGFRSAVTTEPGLNTPAADPMLLRRLPTCAFTDPDYAFELLAGLHMPRAEQRRALVAA